MKNRSFMSAATSFGSSISTEPKTFNCSRHRITVSMRRLPQLMKRDWANVFVVLLPTLAAVTPGFCQGDLTAPLPEGVKAVWEPSRAVRETTSTRERICLNGLWQWQPANAQSEQVPAG